MPITQSLLNQIATADDDRVIRALEALQSGAMTVEIRYNAGVLTAEVTSTVILGKRKPVEKTETYLVLITPGHSECTCKDWVYRHESQLGFACKHQVASCISAQEQREEEQKQAA